MDLGSRQIRTSGKGSGSIEVTLPAELRDLVGLSCRIMLRDGNRPDIVLQPDLQQAQSAFAAIWRAMADSMLPEPTPGFQLASFNVGLQPRPGGGHAAPFLCWRDGLALCRGGPPDRLAVARTLGAFGHSMGPALGIGPGLTASFGGVCGYLCAGIAATPDGQEMSDLASDALPEAGRPGFALDSAEAVGEGADGPVFWSRAGPLLASLADLFVTWTADPSGHSRLRAAWRRGVSIELSGG